MVKSYNTNSKQYSTISKFTKISSFSSISTIQDTSKIIHHRIIPNQIKNLFIYLVTKRNYSMKQAAKKVQMSYSTAKKIYSRFKKSNIEKHSINIQKKVALATYIEVPEGSIRSIPIVCLLAGHIQNS